MVMYEDYEDLVERLRECTAEQNGEKTLWCQAADVIDDLLYICKRQAEEMMPVVFGRWYWDKDGMDWGIGAWRCSACEAMSPMWWNTDKGSPMRKSGHRFCPNCGARMIGVEDGE